MNYLISVEYDGSKYNGLQKLKGSKTVQGELEAVLSKMEERPVKVISSGRTDKGTHALDQKCQFYLKKDTTPYKLRYYINRSTSPYLYVKDCIILEDKAFHARFSVKQKTYQYRINTGIYSAVKNDYVYNYCKIVDKAKIDEAARLFIGEHDFKAFVVGKHKTTNSQIYKINTGYNNEEFVIEITGKAFYTYMVRNIVSILILYSENAISLDQINDMLCDKKKVIEYAPAPASGLYLKEIVY